MEHSAYTTDHFEQLLQQASAMMASDRYALMVIDSVMELFRYDE